MPEHKHSPLLEKGGQGGFSTVAHATANRNIFITMAIMQIWGANLELFNFSAIESQTVGNNGYAAEGHGQGGHDRMQLAQKKRQEIEGI